MSSVTEHQDILEITEQKYLMKIQIVKNTKNLYLKKKTNRFPLKLGMPGTFKMINWTVAMWQF